MFQQTKFTFELEAYISTTDRIYIVIVVVATDNASITDPYITCNFIVIADVSIAIAVITIVNDFDFRKALIDVTTVEAVNNPRTEITQMDTACCNV